MWEGKTRRRHLAPSGNAIEMSCRFDKGPTASEMARSEPDMVWRGILGMRAKRTIVVVLIGFTAASASFVGCNSLVGLDQFSISQSGGSGGISSSTGGMAGDNPTTGGSGGQQADAN